MKVYENNKSRDMTSAEIAAMQDVVAKAESEEKHRPLTAAEVSTLFIKSQINTLTVDDQLSLRMKSYYPNFSEIIGQTVKKGFKFNYNNKLYKTLQPETFMVDHYKPDVGTESLYEEICEEYDGTKYDPIPYNGNMALENGKYYTQNNKLYLCTRDTINPVYNNLDELINLYVEEK